MDKIELPGGAWAALRDPDVVTERQRKPLILAAQRLAAEGNLSVMVDVQDAVVLAMVESWSFDVPVTADGLLDVPAKTLTALRLACEGFAAELMPDFGPTPDPESPSAPSNV